MHTNARTRRQSGFTLIEVALAATVLAIALGSVGLFASSSKRSSDSMVAHTEIERKADRALRMVIDALRDAGVHTLMPDPTSVFGTNALTFQAPVAVSALGAVTFGNQMRIDLRMDDRELDNGIDDNGDGVVDERALVFTRDLGLATQRSVTICHGITERLEGEVANAIDDNGNGIVDESGFCVRRVGDLFFLFLTLEARSREGERIVYTTTTALALHN